MRNRKREQNNKTILTFSSQLMQGFVDLRKGVLTSDFVLCQYTFSQVDKTMHQPQQKVIIV